MIVSFHRFSFSAQPPIHSNNHASSVSLPEAHAQNCWSFRRSQAADLIDVVGLLLPPAHYLPRLVSPRLASNMRKLEFSEPFIEGQLYLRGRCRHCEVHCRYVAVILVLAALVVGLGALLATQAPRVRPQEETGQTPKAADHSGVIFTQFE